MISLNALLGRPVKYYEYPWAMEGRLRDAQSRFRSLFQPSDVGYIFAKSMPRSGHRFLSECLTHYFGDRRRSGSRFLIEEAESVQPLAHLFANRGKAVMGLDEGLTGARAGLCRDRIIDYGGHGARSRSDVWLGPDPGLGDQDIRRRRPAPIHTARDSRSLP